MIRRHVLLLCLLGGRLVPAQGPPMGEVACYSFEGNASDLSGNAHHGLVFGATPAVDRFGAANAAFAFNGSTDHIDVEDFDQFGISAEVSIGFWVRANTSHGNFCVALWPDDFNDRLECSPHYNHNGVNTIFWDLGNASAGGRSTVIPYAFTSVWEHFLFTSSALNNRMRIYQNGTLIHEENHHSTLVNSQRTLGFGGGGTAPYFYLDGDLDDVVLYDRELTTSEGLDLYTYGLPCAFHGSAVPEMGSLEWAFSQEEGMLTFNATTPVSLSIVDGSGRSIQRVDLPAGYRRWSPAPCAPGVYVIHARYEGGSALMKVLLN